MNVTERDTDFLEAPQDFGIQLRLNRRRHFTDYYKK